MSTVLDPPGAPSEENLDDVLDPKGLSDAEISRRNLIYLELREKIQRWFRYHGTKSLKLRKSDNSLTKIIQAFSAQNKPPRRMQAVQFYSKLYYDSRVKATVDAEWPRVVAEAGAKGAKVPSRLKHQNQVLNKIWNAEPKEFQEALKARRDAELEEEVAAWSASKLDGDVPKSAEEYAEALAEASHWLPSFGEALSKRLGLNVAILLTGPIGEKGGRIDVKAIHAGKSRGLMPKIWADHDPNGYKAVVNSLLAFANLCFTQEQCERRALAGTLVEDDSAPHTRSSTRSSSPSAAESSRPSSPTIASRASRPLPSALAAVLDSAQKGKKPAGTQAMAPGLPVMPPPLRMVTSARRPGSGSRTLPSSDAAGAAEVAGGNVRAPPMMIPPPTTTTTTAIPSSPPAASTLSGVCSRYRQAPPSSPSTASTTSLIVLPPTSATSPRSLTSSLPSTPRTASPASPLEAEEASTTKASTTPALVPPPSPSTPSTALDTPATSSPSPSSASHAAVSPAVGPLSKLDSRNCPPEIERIVKYLMTHDVWGANWEHCVATYLEIERFAQFEPRGALQRPTDDRPPEVAAWMKRARKLSDYPVENVDSFGDAWLSWWLNNQPDLDGNESEVDWTLLYVTGPNGIRLFLLTLAWWGAVLGDDEEARLKWANALSKVQVALDRVLVAAAAVEEEEEVAIDEVEAQEAQPRKRRRGAGASTSNKKTKKSKR